jgi:hypothetical protein
VETQRQPAGGPVAARRVRARTARKEADGGSSSGSEKPPEKRIVVTRASQGLTHRHPRAAHTRGAAAPARWRAWSAPLLPWTPTRPPTRLKPCFVHVMYVFFNVLQQHVHCPSLYHSYYVLDSYCIWNGFIPMTTYCK